MDDNPNPRRWNILSKQTLADVSLQSPETTMADLSWPVLMVHGALTDEFPDSEAGATEGFPMLPDGSRLILGDASVVTPKRMLSISNL